MGILLVAGLAISLRPFLWPELSRLLGLGVPAGLVLGAVLIEHCGIYILSNRLNRLAKCAYAMYLTHWFWDIVAEKLVMRSVHPTAAAVLLLLVTPIVVTLLAMVVFRTGDADHLGLVTPPGCIPRAETTHSAVVRALR